ncbi:MAG: helix-turn-helix transcriptional regulator [Hyphomicrobiaceae bacterium]|nr:MAG: helix-turn-helix transcriptional regulator [Hyphomicrobiaceae bacterium]
MRQLFGGGAGSTDFVVSSSRLETLADWRTFAHIWLGQIDIYDHFTRFFRNHLGIPPAEHRRSLRHVETQG